MTKSTVTLESAELHKRRAQIRKLLAPLLPNPHNIVVEQVGVNRDAYVVGALPNGRQPQSYLNPEDPLVATRAPRVLMNYYEDWRRSSNADLYYLDRAYLHMHFAFKDPKQIFALHCDPALERSQQHFAYKRGPHVHIEGATPDVSRAHISLCLNDDTLGGGDLRALTKSLERAIRMVSAELLPCWERAARSAKLV